MKCIITAGGLGTRLIPLTKIIPKEMLPIYDLGVNNKLVLKPILQVIFESLYKFDIREFCFIVGKTKKSVEIHFKNNSDLIKNLNHNKSLELKKELQNLEQKIKKSKILFVTQMNQEGFGNAIECGRKFTKNEPFLLHAGDDIVISKNNNHIKNLVRNFKEFDADIAFLVERVKNPTQYGVVEGKKISKNIIFVEKIEEKPKKPKSNLAIVGIYMFKPKIFEYLQKSKRKSNNERQLDRAFQLALQNNSKIIGVILEKNEKRLDIGTPTNYVRVLKSLET